MPKVLEFQLQHSFGSIQSFISSPLAGPRDSHTPAEEPRNQSILKEIGSEYSLEGLMLKLKLQYFGHLMRRADSLEKTLMLEKIESRTKRG